MLLTGMRGVELDQLSKDGAPERERERMRRDNKKSILTIREGVGGDREGEGQGEERGKGDTYQVSVSSLV